MNRCLNQNLERTKSPPTVYPGRQDYILPCRKRRLFDVFCSDPAAAGRSRLLGEWNRAPSTVPHVRRLLGRHLHGQLHRRVLPRAGRVGELHWPRGPCSPRMCGTNLHPSFSLDKWGRRVFDYVKSTRRSTGTSVCIIIPFSLLLNLFYWLKERLTCCSVKHWCGVFIPLQIE